MVVPTAWSICAATIRATTWSRIVNDARNGGAAAPAINPAD
jgi:hypothetical protein